MLGLLAHGLHLLLVVLGLAGVGALLLPQLRAARFSRAAAFRPPATTAEHEPRVAELRRSFPTPQRFKDQHEREQRALELNDAVLQGMVVARMALDLGQRRRGLSALDGSVEAASRMITNLIGDDRGHLANRPLRTTAALVEHRDPWLADTLPAPAATRDPDAQPNPAGS